MPLDTKTLRCSTPEASPLPSWVADILRKRCKLKQELLKQADLVPVRIAILGGSTTGEVKKLLELFLLAQGLQPSFYESGYNLYSDEVLFENPGLWTFRPDIVFIHTTWHNVLEFPELLDAEIEVEQRIRREVARFQSLWEKIHTGLGAVIIQNNFDVPHLRPLGNLDGSAVFGRVHFLLRLNVEFAKYAQSHTRFLINDILYLSAQLGLAQWCEHTYWYNFHMALGPTATVTLAQNVAAMVKSVYGKSKKCLVLDLDNTLWGGIIGESGVRSLVLGRDHPIGEAFVDFQRYVKGLQSRGVILAVCSKNDPENAKEGFLHPDSVLRIEDFAAFKANWDPKPENIRQIASDLNIGLDSVVFVDDNPAERAFVAEQLPDVAVPDIGSDVSLFAEMLDRERYFEPHQLVQDDLVRGAYYNSNTERNDCEVGFSDYGKFLESLRMTAEIGPFSAVYLDRITQLINKTNQFNLTTRRYTSAEVEAIAGDRSFITLYGRLADRFGDNGLVSVLIGRRLENVVEIDLWVMSCRVFKREMEFAMFDAFVEQCQAKGIGRIVGVYAPSKKNGIVAGLYTDLGLSRDLTFEGMDSSRFDLLCQEYVPRTRYIRRTSSPFLKVADPGEVSQPPTIPY